MYRVVVLLNFVFLFFFEGFSQSELAINALPYMGVHNSFSQPAYLVFTPYKLDVNIIGAKASMFNQSFTPGRKTTVDDVMTGGSKFSDLFAVGGSNIFVNASVVLPSALYAIDNKNVVSFSSRIRAIGFSALREFNALDFFVKGFQEGDAGLDNAVVSAFALAWSEFNFGYSRVLYQKSNHSFSAGVNAKLLMGAASMYFGVDGLSFKTDGSTLKDLNGDLTFYYNDSMDELAQGKDVKIFSNPGFGFDFGLAYKLASEDTSSLLGYKLKLGFSLLDFGSVKFSSGESSINGNVSAQNQTIEAYSDVKSPEELSKRISDNFNVSNERKDSYTVTLPRKFSLNADYNVWKKFYVGANLSYSSLRILKEVKERSGFNNVAALNLRYEKKRWGVYLPYSYHSILKSELGLSGRIGPIILGSNNIFSSLMSNKNYSSLNLYFAARFTILKK